MTQRLLPILVLVFGLAPSARAAQQPRAISGAPSSALHCLTGNAANVHPLGWLAAGGGYTITFDSGIPLTAVIVRLNLQELRSTTVRGTPDFNFTASSSGMMVLHVSSNGQPGCYRFQVSVDPPTSITARRLPEPGVPQRPALDAAPLFAPRTIAGTASSAQYCVGSAQTPIVHDLGRADRESTFSVTFAADFDAIAAATGISLEPGAGAGSLAMDDNSGGNGTPSLSFKAAAGENVVLYVAGVGDATGCYRYRVQIR